MTATAREPQTGMPPVRSGPTTEGHGTGRPSLLDRTRQLTPLIREQRSAAEEQCRMTATVHDALARAGVFRATAPVDVGGAELSLVDQVLVGEELGFADPSVGWCVLNSWASGVLASRLSPSARARLFADPDVFFGFGLAPGGRAARSGTTFQLEGRWPVVSGCEVARWFGLNTVLIDDDGPVLVNGAPDVRFLLVEAGDVEVLETWRDVQGLRGSGSHAVRVTSAAVPEELACRLADPLSVDRPAYRFGLFIYQVGVAGLLVGAARAAIDALIEQAASRVSAATGQSWRDWPGTQDTVAATLAAVTAARAGLVDAAGQAWTVAERGDPMSPAQRAQVYAMTDHAHRVAREAVSKLYTAGSIDALHHGHGLERALRDVHAMSVNWERFRQLHFDAGRVLLGLPPIHPMF